ncbi:MAG: hypothetical protein EA400_14315 [Chromatiaceae bacterium]|nr:MAG: hypothetical protein EA400_14315 [Chromatiaceae bacterium]
MLVETLLGVATGFIAGLFVFGGLAVVIDIVIAVVRLVLFPKMVSDGAARDTSDETSSVDGDEDEDMEPIHCDIVMFPDLFTSGNDR